MPPKERTIIAPEGGWQPHTLYLAEVAMNTRNPIHEAYFHTGFLDPKGNPAGYSVSWSNTSEETGFGALHYLRPIKVLHTKK
jgi:hypothetical protein